MNNDNFSNIQVLLFDVYGTLLDMTDVKRKVNRLLDSKRGYILWTEFLLHYSLVDNATGHHSFKHIARAAMQMAAQTTDTSFDPESFEEIMLMMKHLPLQEGVQEGLSILKDQNYRFAALTNYPLATVTERMEMTGLISYFEFILSAEEIGKYKPDQKAYEYALQKTATDPQNVLMITSHGWDICGAALLGMQAAYIERGGELLYPLSPKPQVSAKDITKLAGELANLNKVG